MKRYTLFLWLVVVLSVMLGFLIGSNQQLVENVQRKPLSGTQKLNQFIRYLDRYYVDQINTDSLASVLIKDIVQKLDPHSFYIGQEDLSAMTEKMQGNFVGIGVSFFMVEDTVNVIRVLEGGPSKRAGLLSGDRILTANNDTLFGKRLESKEIVNRLRGEEQSPVHLKIYRPSSATTFGVRLQRELVPIRSVVHYLLHNTIGYIKINRFADTTYKEFISAVEELNSLGMSQMILDLRDNPGGYLFAAEQISDVFLEEGQAIVTVESNQGETKTTYARSGGIFEQGQVFVLINGESASASEVVAGALQDNDRAWLLGQRSFGKGLVQQQMPLGKQEAVRLTTARYYTPTGRSIQRPFDSGNDAYFSEIKERYQTGELADVNKIPQNDTLAFTTPKGRKVYGGGGIVPDIYLPEEASLNQQWSNYLLQSNLINHFVFIELDKRRNEFQGIGRQEFINQPLQKKAQWLKALKQYIDEQAVPIDLVDKELAFTAIQSYLALQLFDEAAYLEIKHKSDKYVLAATEQIDKSSP